MIAFRDFCRKMDRHFQRILDLYTLYIKLSYPVKSFDGPGSVGAMITVLHGALAVEHRRFSWLLLLLARVPAPAALSVAFSLPASHPAPLHPAPNAVPSISAPPVTPSLPTPPDAFSFPVPYAAPSPPVPPAAPSLPAPHLPIALPADPSSKLFLAWSDSLGQSVDKPRG